MDDATKEKARARLRRVAGQVAGLERMLDEGRYCVDVLHQIAAAEAALDRVGKLVLASHIETCVASAFESRDPKARREKMKELLDVFSRLGHIGER